MARSKFALFDKVLFVIVLIVYLFVVVSVLVTKQVDEQNTSKIIGHFQSIERNKPARGSLNYDLYITEDQKYHKIAAGWADCFSYQSFVDNVKQGQPIELRIRNDNGFISSDIPLVVSIKINNQSYLDLDCVNESIKSDKVKVPLFASLTFIIVCFGLRYRYLNKKKSV